MRVAWSIFSVVLLSLLCFTTIVTSECDDSQPLGLIDDAYQWKKDHNPWGSDYREWWFFTLVDDISGFAWCMGYSISDPTTHPNIIQSSGIAGMLWPDYINSPSDLVSVTDVYPVSYFNASASQADVTIGDYNNITVIDAQTYLVEGFSANSSMSWSLTYTQMVPACREEKQLKDIFTLDWISYMPSAQVTGTLTYKGKTYTFTNAKGYHDHNWGVWPTSLFNWVWAQYGNATTDISLTLGGYNVPETSYYVGYVFMRLNGTKYKLGSLCEDSFSFEPLEFITVNGHKCSMKNHVETESSTIKIVMDYAAVASGINPGGLGLDLLVFEQLSQYNVSVYFKQNNNWELVHNSQGLGFNEWSDVIHI